MNNPDYKSRDIKDIYAILRTNKTGAQASLMKVRHKKLDYIRAIRVIDCTPSSQEAPNYDQFLAECKLLLRIGNGWNNNIVHIHQLMFFEGKVAIELDWIQGKSISEFLKANNNFVETKEALKLLENISEALSYCHYGIHEFCINLDDEEDKQLVGTDPNNGGIQIISVENRQKLVEKYRIVHNDIHSGNIMRRDNDGSYVLLDFGLSFSSSHEPNTEIRKAGAPQYMSPEKWTSDSQNKSQIQTQSDIYSFGILLYEMLAGSVPFPGTKDAELRNQHLTQTPPAIYDLRKKAFEKAHPGGTYIKDYPDWLETIIMKCISKEIKNRYRDGKELHDEVMKRLAETTSPDNSSIQELQEQNNALKSRITRLQTEIELAAMKNKSISQNSSKPHAPQGTIKQRETYKSRRRPNILWIIISAVLLTSTAVFGYLSLSDLTSDSSNDNADVIERLQHERDSLQENIDFISAEDGKADILQLLNEKDTEIESLRQTVSNLTAEINSLRQNNNSSDNQSEIEAKDRTITELREQISAKNKEIQVLREALYE